MHIEEIRAACSSEPFRHFVVHTADGRALEVRHPEVMAIAQNGRSMIVFQPNASYEVVDTRLITRISVAAEE